MEEEVKGFFFLFDGPSKKGDWTDLFLTNQITALPVELVDNGAMLPVGPVGSLVHGQRVLKGLQNALYWQEAVTACQTEWMRG